MQDIQQETIGHRIRLRRRELGYSSERLLGCLAFPRIIFLPLRMGEPD